MYTSDPPILRHELNVMNLYYTDRARAARAANAYVRYCIYMVNKHITYSRRCITIMEHLLQTDANAPLSAALNFDGYINSALDDPKPATFLTKYPDLLALPDVQSRLSHFYTLWQDYIRLTNRKFLIRHIFT